MAARKRAVVVDPAGGAGQDSGNYEVCDSPLDKLWCACAEGDVDQVRALLAAHALDLDVPSRHDKSRTCLAAACVKGRAAVVKELLRAGVDVNRVDSRGRSSLLLASRYGHVDVVQLLLARTDVDVNLATRDDKSTALITAVIHKRGEVVRLLCLDPRVDHSLSTKYGHNAVSSAAAVGAASQLKWLHAAGADLTHRTPNGATPWRVVSQRAHVTCMAFLASLPQFKPKLNGPSVPCNGDWATPLYVAMRNRHKSMVKLLLSLEDVQPDKWTTTEWGERRVPVCAAVTHCASDAFEFGLRTLLKHPRVVRSLGTALSDDQLRRHHRVWCTFCQHQAWLRRRTMLLLRELSAAERAAHVATSRRRHQDLDPELP